MPIPKTLCCIILVGLLLLPEWFSPVGRLGLEVAVFALLAVLIARRVALSDVLRLGPIMLPALAAAMAFGYTLGVLSEPFFASGVSSIASWLRCVTVALLGLYLGGCLRSEQFEDVVRFFLCCGLLVSAFGGVQLLSPLAREITLALYLPESASTGGEYMGVLASRASSTLGGIFQFAFFSATVFLGIWASQLGTRHRSLVVIVGVAALASVLLTQTKGAILAVLVGLALAALRTTNLRRLFVGAVGLVGLAFIFAAIIDAIGLQRLSMFTYLLSGRFDAFLAVWSTDPNVLARVEYLRQQWVIFVESPLFGNMYLTDQQVASDNLYVHTLANTGIVGMAAILSVPIYFWSVARRFHALSSRVPGFLMHALTAQIVMWSGIVACIMGVTWNLFTSHRGMLVFYFLCGLLEGQWSRSWAAGRLDAKPRRDPSIAQVAA